MPLVMQLRTSSTVPIEVEGILPETVDGKSPDEIRRLPIFHGNRREELGSMFDVEVSGGSIDGAIEWRGDMSGVHWIGKGMSRGVMRIDGSAGRHLGSEMTGGEIIVSGNAGDWVGAEMHGGRIHVLGRAGHQVGAAYRGSARGMTGGTILVGGDVGNELGHTMRRGLIAVGGSAADLIGFNMLAGTIFVFGSAGIRPGAGMRRGTIGLFGDDRPPLLPSFRRACRYKPEALSLIFRQLDLWNFVVPDAVRDQPVELYHGDLIEGGRGEILLRA